MGYLGPFILAQLRAKNWKQKDLAKKTGINETTLSKYLSEDRTPPEQALEAIAESLKVNIEVLKVAQGHIPERLHRLLYDQPDMTLTVLSKLAVQLSKDPNHIEELERGVLFRYLKEIGRVKFTYPIDVKGLLKCVYGLEVHEIPFKGMDLPKTRGVLCGLFIPGYAQLGSRHYSNAILLNSDVLRRYGASREREIGRFTMAHEAFHKEMWDSREILASSRKNVVYCRIQNLPVDEDHDFRTERQANRFAGALLMPAKDVRKQIEKYSDPLDLRTHGEALRSRYGVTISALKVRLREVGVSFNR